MVTLDRRFDELTLVELGERVATFLHFEDLVGPYLARYSSFTPRTTGGVR